MSFIRPTNEDRLFERLESADFYDAETLSIIWETKQEIVERLLPPPLEPFEMPIARAYVCKFPRTNFGVSYHETALMLVCQYKGIRGIYILAMHVNNDMAMALGREMFGYPKKMAEVRLKRGRMGASGWGKRRGVKVVEMGSKIMKTISEEEAIEMQLGPNEDVNPIFLFKHFPAQDANGFDYQPRLIRGDVTASRKSIAVGHGNIRFNSSKFDPWGEVEVVKILGATYTISNTSMLKGEVLEELDTDAFIPYSYLKWD
jgi:acetoacetate decarboxylase